MDHLKLFSGTASRSLACKIAQALDIALGEADVGRFNDGEISVKINENIRGKDVFIVQSTHAPAENLMELLVMLDAAKRASVRRVTAVIPYFGYARQDRKDRPRVSITAKLVANLLVGAGADRVLTMDLHAPQIQGFFDIPVDHLFSSPIFSAYLGKISLDPLVVVSPDIGSIKMARASAKRLSADLAIVDKRRPRANAAEVMNIIGSVAGKNVVIRDDMIDTAGTLTEAANAVHAAGGQEIWAACTHPILSGKAVERIEASALRRILVTDTIPLSKENRSDKIEVLSVAGIFAEAIRRIHLEESVSSLFE